MVPSILSGVEVTVTLKVVFYRKSWGVNRVMRPVGQLNPPPPMHRHAPFLMTRHRIQLGTAIYAPKHSVCKH
jgi:hypothetical protein